MKERKRIKNKWVRVLYLPLAILQWSFFTLIFSGAGILFGGGSSARK